MKTPQTPSRSFLIAFTLLTAFALPTQAGVNRWTSSGPDASVSGVAIDPIGPAIVYAGTSQRGVFKSSNGGLSWIDPSNGELDGVNVHSLAIDPLTPSDIYVGTASGVLRSTDGGVSWSNRLTAGKIYNLIFGSQKSTIYAADFDDETYYPGPSAVYKSTDAGETWSRSDSGFVIVPGTLVVDPTRPSTLYAATYDSHGVCKSVDAGSTWKVASRDLAGYFVSALTIDSRDPATLYAGTYLGIFKSVDAGSTWRLASADLGSLGSLVVSALAVDPRSPSTLYAGTSGGVFRSTDGGTTWREFNTGLTNSNVIALVIDRTGMRLHAVSGGAGSGVFDYQISSGALDLSVGSDNKARLLFADPDGRLVFRSVDSSGNPSSDTTYGPYSGWVSRAIADGSDGLTRVLWTNEDGSAALWLLGPEGNQASYRLGPAEGWTAVDVAASIPGTTHILWTDADGRIALWSVENAGPVSTGPAYGPYPGWTAVAIADGQDGLTRVLWNRVDGSTALSFFGPKGLVASHRFGPVAGWTAVDVAVGADGQSRILWTHPDGRMALWRVDGAGNPTALGPIYSPPTGFTASRVAAGPDGQTRVLWSDVNGSAILWTMSADNVFQGSASLGRDPGTIAGAWTGAYNTGDTDGECNPSINYPAQATFQQNGTTVRGTVSSAGSCALDAYGAWAFSGTLLGNTLSGSILSTSNYQFDALGTLTGSTLEIQIVNVGQMHLHR